MKSETHIDPSQLDLLLSEQCDHSLYHWASEHLEACETCRQKLESQAAEARSWSNAKALSSSNLNSTMAPSVSLSQSDPAIIDPALDSKVFETILSEPRHPELLGQLNEYEIERVIGRGGMGIVFKGFDRELNRSVAIKVISPHLAHSGVARKRFEREARAAAAVVHPNVIPIHCVNAAKGHPFIVMPLVSGRSLQTHIEERGPAEPADVVRIGMQIAAGLSAAHQQGLIHRDIKPANILIEHDVSRVVITDFGLARAADDIAMTQTGWLAGTPHYMSPEQARGLAIDPRSDLFSLGAVLYFIATGREPFRAEKPVAVLHRICNDKPMPANQVNPQIPQTLSDIIEKLLEKQPGDRFVSASRVQKLLEDYLASLQHPHSRRRVVKVVTRRMIRKRQRMMAIAASILLMPAAWYAGRLLAPSADPRSPEPNAGQIISTGLPAGLWSMEAFERELSQLQRQMLEFERAVPFSRVPPGPQERIEVRLDGPSPGPPTGPPNLPPANR